jgi:hypothetical protein
MAYHWARVTQLRKDKGRSKAAHWDLTLAVQMKQRSALP